MITVKVECDCGQRYSFDVEPVGAGMPSSVACPVCGADGTSRANEVLARSTAPLAIAAQSSGPSDRLPIVPPPSLQLSRKKGKPTSKRILFSLLWALTLFFGSAAVIFVAWHGYFIATGAPKQRPSENTLAWFGASLVLGPLVVAGFGAFLGVRGLLHWNKKVLFSIVAALAGLAGIHVAEAYLDARVRRSSPAVPGRLAQIARQMNAGVPRQLDQNIRLDETVAGPGNRFTYRVTFLNLSKTDIDIADFVAHMKPELINAYKTHPDMEALRKEEVELRYQYRDKDGNQLGTIIISPKDF
jgi:hypothetical protein